MARRINVDSTIHEAFLSASAAARLLGVRKETLYAYVSRGLLVSHGEARSKGSRYATSEVERLRARSTARAGHAAVAAGALRWGEPVLDSAITAIGLNGPIYRGYAAVDLAARGTSFERCAELLWTGVLPAESPRWESPRRRSKLAAGRSAERAVALPTASLGALERFPTLWKTMARAALADDARVHGTEVDDWARARKLLMALASLGRESDAPTFAGRLAAGLGLRPTPAVHGALDLMLVLVADHELNASSFAARVAASTGADLYSTLVAALATAAGPEHGAAADRVYALAEAIGDPRNVPRVALERLSRGEQVFGFDHPLYPGGDPRAPPLLALERARAAPKGPSDSARVLRALVAHMRARKHHPNVDLALVLACESIGAPSGSASLIFVLGRTAGWVAHALEQRKAGFVLRPRARYVGVPPVTD
ncbi:MAG: citrate synthase [Myxococcales bacterium]|nr:citrate synthase [Myxococcales bacterium]